MLPTDPSSLRAVDTVWFRPREWRRHPLADEPYWVEEEVLVVVDDTIVHQLSWSEPLDEETRQRYDEAMQLRGRLLA